MDYKAKECVTCGSDKIKLISHKNDGENIFYKYRCEACGTIFSTESKYLEQQKRLRKQAEKELIKQAKSYSVSLYEWQKQKLESEHALVSLFDGRLLILQEGYYDDELGLCAQRGQMEFKEV